MSDHRTDPSQRPIASAIPLAPGLIASVLVGGLVGVTLARLAGWSAEGTASVTQSASYGALSVAIGAALGLALVWPASSRTSRKLGLMVLAASSARMMVSLMAGIILFFTARPQPYVFFVALGAAFLFCLVIESLWAMSAIRRAAAGSTHVRPVSSGPTGVSA